jgi:hypothetical protein
MSTLGLSVAAAQGRPCGEITRVIFRLSAAKLRTQRRPFSVIRLNKSSRRLGYSSGPSDDDRASRFTVETRHERSTRKAVSTHLVFKIR